MPVWIADGGREKVKLITWEEMAAPGAQLGVQLPIRSQDVNE